MNWNWIPPYDKGSYDKALKKDMTPNRLNAQEHTVFYFDPDGYTITASYEECTCPDFRINKRSSSPCKHMLRLAMETGAISDAVPQRDEAAACKREQDYQATVAIKAMIKTVSECPLQDAARLVAQMRTLFKARKGIACADISINPFPFADRQGDRYVPVSDKKLRERFKAVESALANRLLNIAIAGVEQSNLFTALSSTESGMQ